MLLLGRYDMARIICYARIILYAYARITTLRKGRFWLHGSSVGLVLVVSLARTETWRKHL